MVDQETSRTPFVENEGPHPWRRFVAVGDSFTPNLYAYNLAFINQDVNYAAAIAFLLGVVIAVISFVVQTTVARREGVTR